MIKNTVTGETPLAIPLYANTRCNVPAIAVVAAAA
jgi:hypothetical protein